MADIDPNSAKAKDIDVLMEQARKAGDLLKALSHESRLLILCILAEGEKSVSELEELLSVPQAAVSQQLARLRFDRLVQTRRDGRMVYYSIASEERSEEHTSELQSLMRISYAVFCLKKKNQNRTTLTTEHEE